MQPRLAPLLPITLALVSTAAHAQQPVREYEPASRYATFNLAVQLVGDPEHGRELGASWGRMRAMGPSRAWMPALELAAGVSPGTREFVEGITAGPRITLARAFPGQYVGMGRKKPRGEPYLLAGAAMYGVADFYDDTRWGGAPAISAGFGFRVFDDAWDVDLSTVEVVLERRFGIQDGPLRLYVRIGRARAPQPPAPPRAGPLSGR